MAQMSDHAVLHAAAPIADDMATSTIVDKMAGCEASAAISSSDDAHVFHTRKTASTDVAGSACCAACCPGNSLASYPLRMDTSLPSSAPMPAWSPVPAAPCPAAA